MSAWSEMRDVRQLTAYLNTHVTGDRFQRTHSILRLGVFACFLGHGAFGILVKPAWVPYFAVWGVSEPLAWRLMPIVGTIDVILAFVALVLPLRAALLWMVFWGFQTACLRPLAGQTIWEVFERAGNFGVPLALLWFGARPHSWREWFTVVRQVALAPRQAGEPAWILRVTTAMLLVGHGALVLAVHQPDWAAAVGGFEIALAFAILARPAPWLLLFAGAWKLGTEALRLPAGEPVWEFVERGGSYAAPLALYFLSRPGSSGSRPRDERLCSAWDSGCRDAPARSAQAARSA